MSVIFTLYQEGNVRSTGFQTTEWLDSNPLNTTAAYRQAFVMRRQGPGLPDVFERVATPADYGVLRANPLTAFDFKGPFTTDVSMPLAGDTLRLYAVPFPHWAATTAINGQSYTIGGDGYMEFTISAYAAWRTRGTNDPPTVDGNQLITPGYIFTDADVGRFVRLSGFVNGANNTTARVVQAVGGMAVTNRTFVSEVGGPSANWIIDRIEVASAKPIPRIEGNVQWQVRQQGTGTVILAGTLGSPLRADADLLQFSDDRAWLLHPTIEIAQDHFDAVRAYMRSLQAQLAGGGGSFQAVGPYVFGP